MIYSTVSEKQDEENKQTAMLLISITFFCRYTPSNYQGLHQELNIA